VSKDGSAYGKIVNLIVERQLMQRPEIVALRTQLENVLRLFRPDPENPQAQAQEIRDVEARINARLNEVVGGVVSIETAEPDIKPVLLPSTTLVLRDRHDAVKTPINHQGHGLQRTLVMTLLQILAEIQAEGQGGEGGEVPRPRSVILAVEEPELYMHPQMERKMRDALYRLASQPGMQVICTTHSPVFLDMGQRHKAIVRVVKDGTRRVSLSQVTDELFSGPGAEAERDRLKLLSRFHPSVNELFFAKRVVLLEEETALTAFERAAELTGLFLRHPHVRRDVTLVDAKGKDNLPMLQQVLNHFGIPYTVIHDEDRGNMNPSGGEPVNGVIAGFLATANGTNTRHMISPTNLEAMLGYAAGKDRPYRALKRVEELNGQGALPAPFVEALNWAYFGQPNEPQPG
jgi:putative ATP-dependent endonuclease of OLD family